MLFLRAGTCPPAAPETFIWRSCAQPVDTGTIVYLEQQA